MRYCYLPLAFAWLCAPTMPAQTEPISPARLRAANRQALREARRAEAPYKDTHLDAPRQHLRRGESEPVVSSNTARFGRDGTPRVRRAPARPSQKPRN